MKITKRIYAGRWSKVNIPTEDSVSVYIRRFLGFYIAWKTLKEHS